jgi:transcriptional regulator with XRE-family HTH domain
MFMGDVSRTNDNKAVEFGKLPGRMRSARERAGLTQEQVAEQMGKSRAAVSSWESGVETPRLIHIKRFASICGTRITRLLAGE